VLNFFEHFYQNLVILQKSLAKIVINFLLQDFFLFKINQSIKFSKIDKILVIRIFIYNFWIEIVKYFIYLCLYIFIPRYTHINIFFYKFKAKSKILYKNPKFNQFISEFFTTIFFNKNNFKIKKD